MKHDANLYQDGNHGGWVLECLSISGWYVVGVYGTREAAISVIKW